MNGRFTIRWLDSRREPQCVPDPRYPLGQDIDGSGGKPSCSTPLPYPARRWKSILKDILAAAITETTGAKDVFMDERTPREPRGGNA